MNNNAHSQREDNEADSLLSQAALLLDDSRALSYAVVMALAQTPREELSREDGNAGYGASSFSRTNPYAGRCRSQGRGEDRQTGAGANHLDRRHHHPGPSLGYRSSAIGGMARAAARPRSRQRLLGCTRGGISHTSKAGL